MFADNGIVGGMRLGDDSKYGCAFRKPLLPCKSGQPLDPSHPENVTKIAKKMDLQPEVEVGKLLGEYTFASNYFVIPREGMCKPSGRIFQVDPATRGCEIIQKRGVDRLQMIQMPYGGDKTVSAFFRKSVYNPATFDFYSFGRHLLEAIALETLKGVAHRDLHTANILLDENDVPRIIDYGMAYIHGKTDPSDMLEYSFNPRFPQRPPEVDLWLAKSANVPMNTAVNRILSEKRGILPIAFYSGAPPAVQRQELMGYINKSAAFRQGALYEWMDSYWHKYDAWAVGNMLLSQYHKMAMHPGFARNKLVVGQKAKIVAALRALTRLSPIERADAVEALRLWAPDSAVLRLRKAQEWLGGQK